jgi:hypothetical protein
MAVLQNPNLQLIKLDSSNVCLQEVAFVHFTGWIIADADFKANWRNQLGYNNNKNVSEKTPEPFVPDRGTINMICLPACLLQRGMRASSKERHLTYSSLQTCLKDRPTTGLCPMCSAMMPVNIAGGI